MSRARRQRGPLRWALAGSVSLENACAGLEAPLHAPADIPAPSQLPPTPCASVWPIAADSRQLVALRQSL
ncbi:hypothetical protein K523DRAFT_326272 [Schizophyllum commune Tattone D]|nr:hypothetical protein K523DRAFT_326272 [Schizophyllum commune Tattone D]